MRNSFTDFLVTGQAQVGTCHQEQLSEFRLVGAVAFCAFPGDERCMPGFSVFQCLFDIRMARETELVLGCYNHRIIIGCMRIMAGKAHAFLERDVIGAACSRSHEALMTLRTEVGAGDLHKLFIV